MIRMAPLAISAALVAITSCSVRGTDITAVPPTAADAFETRDTALATTEPVDAWWTTFQDARMLKSEPRDTEWNSRAFELIDPSGFLLTIYSDTSA